MMNTWDVARWMSEANKVFNAAIGGPIDAIKFEDYTQEVTPWGNCNTKHETEGWRTRSGIGNDSHALTDQVFVNFRLRDTDDWDCSYIVNCDTSYNAKKANAHGIGLKLIHEDSPADNPDYSWEENGVENGATNDWGGSQPKLITKAGKWTLHMRSLRSGSCGTPNKEEWRNVGSFTAKEAHQDCYMANREEGSAAGVCGDCWDGYTEDANGDCVENVSTDNGGQNGDGDGDGGVSDGTGSALPLVIGVGVIGLAIFIKKRRSA